MNRNITYGLHPESANGASRLDAIMDGCRFVWNVVLSENEEDMLLHEMYGQKLEYKAAEPTAVNPAYTSQTCNECGVIDKSSRKAEEFSCVSCGHSAHADVNAARNVMASGIGATARRGALALVTPMNREYIPLRVAA